MLTLSSMRQQEMPLVTWQSVQSLGSQPSFKGGLDLSKAHLNTALSNHRATHSIGSNLSVGTVLDEAAMRELDQVG